MDFTETRSEQSLQATDRAEKLAKPGFGNVFTDHMVTISWNQAHGWHNATLTPYAPIVMDPSSMVFHYGQAIFEGIKAYRQPGGGIALFRPLDNARRFIGSAERMAMPALPEELFLEAVERLVMADHLWVPDGEGQSLYIRPFMIATEAALGVRPAKEYLFMVIAGPVDSFFPGGVRPLTVWVSEEYARAFKGGTGTAKCAGNYAAGMLAQAESIEHGCDQVVWLDAVERRWVEEMGGMNMCFVWDGPRPRLVTPALTGTLLAGIVRASLLELATDMGLEVAQEPVSVDDWRVGAQDGRVKETFACGTAAVIAPIGKAKSTSGEWTIGDGTAGPITLQLRKALLDLQHGRAADPHSWMHQVAVPTR